jgi:hypothetical protein
MISLALILMTLPSRVAAVRARRAVLSAKGAGSFPAWGSAPGNRAHESTSAESAIHLEAMPGVLSRAFSANTPFVLNPGAMPQAIIEKAPLALNCSSETESAAGDSGSYNAIGGGKKEL